MASYADSSLSLTLQPDQVGTSTELGVLEVAGLGPVRLVASKSGSQLTVLAEDSRGKVIGKAETVVGLRDTPIYVMTSNGLEKITIYWGSE